MTTYRLDPHQSRRTTEAYRVMPPADAPLQLPNGRIFKLEAGWLAEANDGTKEGMFPTKEAAAEHLTAIYANAHVLDESRWGRDV